jgi:predicted nucleotidyltransferase
MSVDRTRELRELAQRIADALPPVVEEVVLTGSVSRGVADEVSDIEMLFVTTEQLSLDDCFEHAGRLGFERMDTWGVQGTEANRVFGFVDGVPVETIWWSREFAERSVDAILGGQPSGTAEALANGVPLRTVGLLDDWQARLRDYPDELAAARIEDAALPWGGFHASGVLTLLRPGDRLQLVEWLFDSCLRVLQILYALNRVWPPTTKRLAERVEELAVKPDRLAERVEEALTEPEPTRAMIVLSELQLDTLALAPNGPNVDRARRWVGEALELLRRAAPDG